MKKFAVPLLVIMFLALMSGSIKMVSGDHLEPGLGIFKNELEVNSIPAEDSKYEVYLIVEIRNTKGELISITETIHGKIIPHEITDNSFDESLGQKEIIMIDNIKYEKVQYTNTVDYVQELNSFTGLWYLALCGDFVGHSYTCIPIFSALTASMYIEDGDEVKNHWTILREMN